MRNLFKHCNKARLCWRVSIAAASIDNLLRKMAEPKGRTANVHLELFHPVSSALSCSEVVFGRNMARDRPPGRGGGVAFGKPQGF